MNEIKKCPFCGGEAKLNGSSSGFDFWIWCECRKCGAKTEKYGAATRMPEQALENIEECKRTVINLWNKRV